MWFKENRQQHGNRRYSQGYRDSYVDTLIAASHMAYAKGGSITADELAEWARERKIKNDMSDAAEGRYG